MGALILKVATLNLHRGVWPGRPFRSNLPALAPHLQGVQLLGLQEVRARLMAPLAQRLGSKGTFRPSFCRFGNALFSPWPVTRVQRHPLPRRWFEEPRVAVEAQVATPAGALTTIVTHLGLSRVARQRQVQHLAELIAKIRGPRLLFGDFNGQPGAHEFAPLRGAGLRLVGPTGPTFPKLGLTLDHIYISEGFSVVDFEVLPVAGSDHLPVVARLRLQVR